MKKTLAIVLLLSMSLVLFACNKATETSTDGNLSNAGDSVKVVENQKSVNEVVDEEEKENENHPESSEENEGELETKDTKEDSYKVSLVYPSTSYIVDGNEEEKFIHTTTSIQATQEDIVEKVLNNLNNSSLEGAESIDLDKYTINKSHLEGDQAIIDFSSDNLNGSGMEEEIIVTSMVDSLLSVDGVKSVKFLVDGNDASSLMGHMDTSQAFTNFIGK